MWILVGLGNPGGEYDRTRHNYGFRFIDRLCKDWKVGLSRTTPHAVFEVVRRRRQEIALVKPLTYMNRSGVAVRELLRHFGEEPERLVVAHDDLDLELGVVKMRASCGPGSHNGAASVVEELGTQDFGRLRFGVGPRPEDGSGADFVLSPFGEAEEEIVAAVLDRTAKGIETLLSRGFPFAMNEINRVNLSAPEDPKNDADPA